MASGMLVKVVGLADAYRKEVEANKELKEENEKLKRRVEVLELRSRSVSESKGPANIKKRLKLEDSEDLTQQYQYSQQISESDGIDTASTQQPDDPYPDQSQSLFTVYKQH